MDKFILNKVGNNIRKKDNSRHAQKIWGIQNFIPLKYKLNNITKPLFLLHKHSNQSNLFYNLTIQQAIIATKNSVNKKKKNLPLNKHDPTIMQTHKRAMISWTKANGNKFVDHKIKDPLKKKPKTS